MLRGDDQPRTELGKPLGTYSAYLSPRYRGNAKDYLDTLERLRQMPVPDLVLPGHPRADVSPQSPCLSQERWAVAYGPRDFRPENDSFEIRGRRGRLLGWHAEGALARALLSGQLPRFGSLRFLCIVEVFRGGRARWPWPAGVFEGRTAAVGPRAERSGGRIVNFMRS